MPADSALVNGTASPVPNKFNLFNSKKILSFLCPFCVAALVTLQQSIRNDIFSNHLLVNKTDNSVNAIKFSSFDRP